MWKKLAMTIIISMHSTLYAHECNYEMLEMNADVIFENILYGNSLSKQYIEDSLNFLTPITTPNTKLEKYKDTQFIKELIKLSELVRINEKELQDSELFESFLTHCNTIYTQSQKENDSTSQMAINMLSEKVLNKLNGYLIQAKEIKKIFKKE
ncbi:MAG TPA: hypothetical protein VNJ29_02420 [Candidatus Nitrosotenuis sp.]|jgi:Lhr-like helicase|nr:hypothetical protein [Candidatus Nitrosotenuis sp.]